MRDYSAKIINDLIRVCKDIHPDLDNPDGSITGIYKREDFEDLFQTIGDLYHRLVVFHIPTAFLTIEVEEKQVYFEMAFEGMKMLLEEKDEE